MSKEEKLINAIVSLADEHLGGERSRTAKELFYDIADEARQFGYSKLERIARRVGGYYDYD
jgi:hypothetical protein